MSGTGSPDTEPSPPYKEGATTNRNDIDVEAAAPHGMAQWFGGPKTTVGPRIGPVLDSITIVAEDSDDSASAIIHRQKAAEQGADIQYRSCSWQMVCATSPSSLSLSLFLTPWTPVCMCGRITWQSPGATFSYCTGC